MTTLPIITGKDNPMLRAKATPVKKVTKKLLKLISDMEATMEGRGVGLAAPQVSQSIRLCLALVNGKVTPLINPDITWKSRETALDQEGCLSLPDVWLQIPRAVEIAVSYTDEKGKKQERRLRDFDARVVQHEVDHLDGILIIDYPQKDKEG